MGLFSETLNTMEDLYLDQLQDLYDAERRLTKALPQMAKAAKSPQLKRAFETHLSETKGHVNRLERCFELFGQKPKAKTCDAMKGLVLEGEAVINASGDDDVRDAALIAAAQRVEHYEMAGYGCLRTFAMRVGQENAAELLQETLDEEEKTDRLLTEIAEASVNVKAAR
ncbi:MAG: ferritin-like domain-containing protein [Planctomycetaceae bacterium]